MSDSAVSTRSTGLVRLRPLAREWVFLGGLTLGVAAFYFAIAAPVIDPPTYLDPWYYTALFVNFKFLFHTFGGAYYPSRLPWIIPGVVAHRLFGPIVAFFVLHAVFFFAAGLFAYLLVRRFFGPTIALATYGVLLLSPLFYDAYSNDYPDGALITYLLGGVYFLLTIRDARRPWLRAALSGFLLAAAMGTNLFATFVVACLLLLYVAMRFERPIAWIEIGRDVAFGVIGAVFLVVVCGAFSKANGGEFLFFMPSVRALQVLNSADYKTPGTRWVLSEPELLVPAFVAMCALFSLRGVRPSGEGRRLASRFALGAAVSTLVMYGILLVWEFAFTGDFFETTYYFSLFNVGIILCSAAVLHHLRDTGLASGSVLVTAVLLAVIVPTVLVFWRSVLPTGRRGAVVVVVLMVIALAAIVARRWFARLFGPAPTAVGLAVLVLFSAAYAVDAGTLTGGVFLRNTYTERRDVQSVALQLIGFMRSSGLQQSSFRFWYNPSDDPALDGIQSTYFWGYTQVGRNMPVVDAATRTALDAARPSAIVLLCKSHACRGAVPALEAAGYHLKPLKQALLEAGHERVWVRAFSITTFATST